MSASLQCNHLENSHFAQAAWIWFSFNTVSLVPGMLECANDLRHRWSSQSLLFSNVEQVANFSKILMEIWSIFHFFLFFCYQKMHCNYVVCYEYPYLFQAAMSSNHTDIRYSLFFYCSSDWNKTCSTTYLLIQSVSNTTYWMTHKVNDTKVIIHLSIYYL